MHGLDDDDVLELVATDRSVTFVSSWRFVVYDLQDLQSLETGAAADTEFVAADACVESVAFVPRSDDPLVAFRPSSSPDAVLRCPAACTLVLRTGEAPVSSDCRS